MKILAIETSTMSGGVAIMDDSGLLVETRFNVSTTHSETLLAEIDHALRQSVLRISDIDILAVAIGPGSFTGLRVGLSTVKGISYANGKPVVSVPTLEAMAWNFPYCKHPVCILLDARKKEVYAAMFKWGHKRMKRLIAETSLKAGDFCRVLPDSPSGKFIFAGEGAFLYRGIILDILGDKAVFAPVHKSAPSPSNIAFIGMEKAKCREFSELYSLVPFYIRRAEAELKKQEA